MELKWSTPRTESKAASLNFEIKNEETFCFRDIVDELEEGETDLEASLKEAYRYSWIYHPTVQKCATMNLIQPFQANI